MEQIDNIAQKMGRTIKGYSTEIQKFIGNVNFKDLQNKMQQVESLAEETGKKIGSVKYDSKSIEDYIKAYTENMDLHPRMKMADKMQLSKEKIGNQDFYMKAHIDTSEAKREIKGFRGTIEQEPTTNGFSSFFNSIGSKITQIIPKVKKIGTAFNGIKPSISGIENSLNRLPRITLNINNNIKAMSTRLKQGLGHILKYAGALLSIRGIYGLLRSSASAWLSSQNAQAQQLSANIEYLKYSMGSVFAPIIEYITNLVYQLMKAVQSLVYVFSGVNIFAKATASSMNKTAGSAKQASKSLASVHSDISNVSENNNSGGGITSPNIDLSQMENTPNSIVDAIKNGDWYKVGETIGQKLNEAMEKIPWDKIQNTAKKIGKGTADLLNGSIATTNWGTVGNTFAQGLNTIIYAGYEFVTTFNWSTLGESIANAINSFFKNTNWETLAQTLSKGVQGILDSISGFLKEIDIAEIIISVGKFIFNIDLEGLFDSFYEALGSLAGSLAKGIIKLIEEGIKKAGEKFKEWKENFKEHGIEMIAGLLEGMLNPFAKIKEWIDEHIFQPFIKGFKEAFQIHSPSKVMEEMGQYIIEGLKNGLSNIWETISSIFVNLKDRIVEKFAEIKTNLGQWAENTKETIKNWANNAKEKIGECWNNASNKVREKAEDIKINISNKLRDAKTTISTWSENVKSTWSTHWNDMSNKVQSGLNTARSHISTWGNGVKTTFSDLGRNASTWGKDLVGNIASGIKNNIHKVTSAVSSVANKIKSYLHFTEPDVGPLSNFHTYMPDMIDLMANGIHSNMSKITNELENLTTSMSYTINSPDISPIPLSENVNSNAVQLRSSILDNLSDMLSSNEQNVNITIPLTVQVGNKKIGQILIEDLRDMTRRTGKDIEVLVGG